MKKITLAVVLLVCISALPAMAVNYWDATAPSGAFIGSLSGDDGTLAFVPDPGPWSEAVVDWAVWADGDDWYYNYYFSVPSKDFSHIILEVSPTFGDATYDGPAVEGPKWYSGNDPSNPDMPGSVYGLKLDKLSDTEIVWQFVSDREPMWGDFYAKDGKTGGENVAMWNIGFGDDSNENAAWDANITTHLLVPDTGEDIRTPELSTWLLLSLSGLAGVFVTRRRKS